MISQMRIQINDVLYFCILILPKNVLRQIQAQHGKIYLLK